MADNRVVVELGTVIKNRGEWDSLAQNAKLYKDNVVQYNGSAYIVKSAPASGIGKDILPTNTAYYGVFAGVGELATGSDFTNPDATKRAKVPTVGAVLDALDSGSIPMSNLPTSDPQIAGLLWNDGGVLKVSSGS